MKKTLVALAAMTAMCGASATSLTLYGVVDTGLAYNSIDWDGYKGLEGQGGDSFGMQSGQRSGSRWGMKAMACRSGLFLKMALALTRVPLVTRITSSIVNRAFTSKVTSVSSVWAV